MRLVLVVLPAGKVCTSPAGSISSFYLPFRSSSLQMLKTNALMVLYLDCLANADMSLAMNAGSSKRSRVICAICAN